MGVNKPQFIILHTAAAARDTSSQEIDRWHREGNGWDQIGYHYVIRKGGIIEAGRHETEQGAHCLAGGMNRKSVGICLSGHGNKEDWTVQQAASLIRLILKLQKAYGIPTYNILGHREMDPSKACPGTLIDMDEFRAGMTDKVNQD